MGRITSKLQTTVPKAIADTYGLKPGDEIDWVAADQAIHVIPKSKRRRRDPAWRLKLFDAATERQRERAVGRKYPREPADRGWTREDLYLRDVSR